jgi:hypothetical protein
VAGKKRNLSKIAGLHTGTDKNGKTFYFGEVNEGSTLLILPNMNDEGDGAGRFDYIAYFVPNNRYDQAEAEPETSAAANGAAEAKATPPASPPEKSEPANSPAKAPVEEKPKEVAAPVTEKAAI